MISLIAAIGKNNELGKDNNLIWHLPGDLKFFKDVTTNHTIIMGYNTYESIGRALPNRRNVLLTRKELNIDNIFIYHDINELIKDEIKDEEVFIIGGSSLYNYFYNIADKMYLTLIDAECKDATVFFPNINYKDWKTTIIKECKEDGIKYKHVLFERINNE